MMIFIRQRKVTIEGAKKVLQFFIDHPERQDCMVGYDRGDEFTGTVHDTFIFKRGDISKLEKRIIEEESR